MLKTYTSILEHESGKDRNRVYSVNELLKMVEGMPLNMWNWASCGLSCLQCLSGLGTVISLSYIHIFGICVTFWPLCGLGGLAIVLIGGIESFLFV